MGQESTIRAIIVQILPTVIKTRIVQADIPTSTNMITLDLIKSIPMFLSSEKFSGKESMT